MISILSQPWPWYVSGPLITFIMFLLLWTGGKFGVSSNLRSLCAIGGGGKYSDFFRFNWKNNVWNLVFVLGAVLGGFIASNYLQSPVLLTLSDATVSDLQELNVSFNGGLLPAEFFTWSGLMTVKGFLTIVVGGFLVGFGARWAGGCTSGHAISGLSNLQIPSLIAVIGFFIGGLMMTHFLLPLILK